MTTTIPPRSDRSEQAQPVPETSEVKTFAEQTVARPLAMTPASISVEPKTNAKARLIFAKSHANRGVFPICKSNVSKRIRILNAKATTNLIGFLCLVVFDDSHTHTHANTNPNPNPNKAFMWIPKQEIDALELQTFRRIAKYSKSLFGPNPPPSPNSNPPSPVNAADKVPSRPISPFDFFLAPSSHAQPSQASSASTMLPKINTAAPSDYISIPPDAVIFSIVGIRDVVLEIGLTLTVSGDEAALVKLVFKNRVTVIDEYANFPDDSEDLNALWFERDEDGKENIAVETVVSELHIWLVKACQKGLKPVFDELEESSNQSSMIFRIMDIKDLERTDDGKVATPVAQNREEWPKIVLPISESSAIYRIGAFGLGIASKIAGPDITNRVENLSKNAAWDVMNGLSQVSKFATETGRHVVEHPLARPMLPLIPSQITAMLMSSEEAEKLLSEYDSAHMYLANFADSIQERVRNRIARRKDGKAPSAIDYEKEFEKISVGFTAKRNGAQVTGEQWVLLFDENGRLVLPEDEVRRVIFNGGVSPECRKDIWKYLLKVYAWDSTESERIRQMKILIAQYESMKRQWQTILADARKNVTGSPMSPSRKSPVKATFDESAAVGDEKVEGDVVSKFQERKNRVEKDVIRTDRSTLFYKGIPEDNDAVNKISESSAATFSPNLESLKNVLITYTVYDFDLGYVQGMNDLLSPILAVTNNEIEAFWTFKGWMDLKKSNFFRDQSGMRNELSLLELLIKFMDPPLYAHLGLVFNLSV
ncbi:GTPase activating protein [Physocladia obscura]|uniref:GTPase activating protein n=1 Tax=Physocladia obscura TaxID=109957 RepID=A0AAD5T1H3_9FUNG|nr:GTPase activating protein [Physocladia obscura]